MCDVLMLQSDLPEFNMDFCEVRLDVYLTPCVLPRVYGTTLAPVSAAWDSTGSRSRSWSMNA